MSPFGQRILVSLKTPALALDFGLGEIHNEGGGGVRQTGMKQKTAGDNGRATLTAKKPSQSAVMLPDSVPKVQVASSSLGCVAI